MISHVIAYGLGVACGFAGLVSAGTAARDTKPSVLTPVEKSGVAWTITGGITGGVSTYVIVGIAGDPTLHGASFAAGYVTPAIALAGISALASILVSSRENYLHERNLQKYKLKADEYEAQQAERKLREQSTKDIVNNYVQPITFSGDRKQISESVIQKGYIDFMEKLLNGLDKCRTDSYIASIFNNDNILSTMMESTSIEEFCKVNSEFKNNGLKNLLKNFYDVNLSKLDEKSKAKLNAFHKDLFCSGETKFREMVAPMISNDKNLPENEQKLSKSIDNICDKLRGLKTKANEYAKYAERRKPAKE